MIKSVSDIKPGNVFIYKNELYILVSSQHNKTGRARAFVKAKIKNLEKGSTTIVNFSSKEKLESVFIEKAKIQYLYNDNENAFFMLLSDYSNISINIKNIEWELNFLESVSEYEGVFHESKLLKINLPAKVKLKVVLTKDAVRGNTVSSGRVTKKSTLETGYTLSTPIFIKNNDYILVSTKDGEYVSRANNFK